VRSQPETAEQQSVNADEDSQKGRWRDLRSVTPVNTDGTNDLGFVASLLFAFWCGSFSDHL